MSIEREVSAANEAHRRAFPVSRLLSSGMAYEDVLALHASVADGKDWHQVAEELGSENGLRAEDAIAHGRTMTARGWHLYASACYRTGQAVLPDSKPDKARLYRKAIEHFGNAGELTDPPFEHRLVAYGTRQVRTWLIRPAVPRPPTVVVLGGFDGWREEHEFASRPLLERGIAVVLMEAPGQGETRIFGRNFMHEGYEHAFSAVLDMVRADSRLADSVGIWGNSFGGCLAARAALADKRFRAVCVNGGSVQPAEVLERFPRLTSRVQDLFGLDDPDRARTALESFRLDAGQLASLTAPLLVLHGAPDRIFLIENARSMHAWAGSADKTFREWADGEHCIYNHAEERNLLVADWFTDRLNPEHESAEPGRRNRRSTNAEARGI